MTILVSELVFLVNHPSGPSGSFSDAEAHEISEQLSLLVESELERTFRGRLKVGRVYIRRGCLLVSVWAVLEYVGKGAKAILDFVKEYPEYKKNLRQLADDVSSLFSKRTKPKAAKTGSITPFSSAVIEHKPNPAEFKAYQESLLSLAQTISSDNIARARLSKWLAEREPPFTGEPMIWVLSENATPDLLEAASKAVSADPSGNIIPIADS